MFKFNLLKRKSLIFNIKKNEFVNLGFQYGHLKRRFLFLMSFYVLGIRNNLVIFNLDYTLINFRRSLQFIIYLIKNHGKLLFLSSFKDESSKGLVTSLVGKVRQSYYDGPYIGGMVSNFRIIQSNLSSENISSYRLNSVLGAFLPSCVCVGDSNKFYYVFKESSYVGISSTGLIDSDLDFRDVLYPVIANNESRVLVYFYYFIILYNIKTVRLSLKREFLLKKVASIKRYYNMSILSKMLRNRYIFVKRTPQFLNLLYRLDIIVFFLRVFATFKSNNFYNYNQGGLYSFFLKFFSYLQFFKKIAKRKKGRVRLIIKLFFSKPVKLFKPTYKKLVNFYDKKKKVFLQTRGNYYLFSYRNKIVKFYLFLFFISLKISWLKLKILKFFLFYLNNLLFIARNKSLNLFYRKNKNSFYSLLKFKRVFRFLIKRQFNLYLYSTKFDLNLYCFFSSLFYNDLLGYYFLKSKYILVDGSLHTYMINSKLNFLFFSLKNISKNFNNSLFRDVRKKISTVNVSKLKIKNNKKIR